MAKQSGITGSLLVAGYDLSGDVGSLSRISNPSTLLDVTSIDKSGYERIYGLYDGAIEFQAFFNDADDQEHAVLKAKGSAADRVATYLQGATIGNVAAGIVAKQINYDGTRGADGSLTFAIQCLGNGHGLDWCQQLTAGKRTDTEATDGSSLDGGASTALGWAAYLQVTAFDGTDVTIKIQDSANDSAWSDLSGGGFTAVTAAPTSQRIAGAAGATVRRYLRVSTTTTGGFNSVTFNVILTREPYAL